MLCPPQPSLDVLLDQPPVSLFFPWDSASARFFRLDFLAEFLLLYLGLSPLKDFYRDAGDHLAESMFPESCRPVLHSYSTRLPKREPHPASSFHAPPSFSSTGRILFFDLDANQFRRHPQLKYPIAFRLAHGLKKTILPLPYFRLERQKTQLTAVQSDSQSRQVFANCLPLQHQMHLGKTRQSVPNLCPDQCNRTAPLLFLAALLIALHRIPRRYRCNHQHRELFVSLP